MVARHHALKECVLVRKGGRADLFLSILLIRVRDRYFDGL